MGEIKFTRAILFLVSGLLLLGAATRLEAETINPGFDLLSTPKQPATIAGLGDVIEHGVPLGLPNAGNADTIVQRFTGLADGQSGVINAQIVALSLGGTVLDGPFAGLNFSVALDPSHASLGQLNVTNPTGPTGGTFTSFFDVFTDISLFNGSTLVAVVPHEDLITSVGVTPFASTPVADYPNNGTFPSGGFYITPAGVNHTGPHPHVDPASDLAATPLPTSAIGGLVLIAGLGLVKLRQVFVF